MELRITCLMNYYMKRGGTIMEEKIKEIFDTKKFTKTFIKKLFTNYIFVGIFAYILLEISQEFFPDILRILVILLLLYLLIKKVHLAAISETFMLGKINSNDISKISKNIIIVYCVLFLIGVIGAFGSYLLSLRTIENLSSAGLIFESLTGSKEVMQSNAIRSLIVNIIIQVVANGVLAFLCVNKFKKESNKSENIAE